MQVVQLADGSWNVRFREIQKIDEGDYFCVASNDYAIPSSRTSRVVTVSVGGTQRYQILMHGVWFLR